MRRSSRNRPSPRSSGGSSRRRAARPTWVMGRPDCTITPMCRAWGGFALAAALLASAPTDVTAQVFVATSPRPDFTIGPVFVGATAPADVAAPVNVSVTWNLVPPRGSRPSPQRPPPPPPPQIAAATPPGGPDPALVHYVEARGL